MNTINKLTDLISEKFDIDKSSLQADLPLSEYGLDSLALAELLFTIEDDFDVKFPDRPEHINTLAQLAALIDELRLSQNV